MTVEEIKVKFSADISKIHSAMQKVKSDLKAAENALDGVSDDIERARRSGNKKAQDIAKALEKEVSAYRKAEEKTNQYSKALEVVKQKVEQTSNKFSQQKKTLDSENNRLEKMKTAYNQLGSTMAKLSINTSVEQELKTLESTLETNKRKALEVERAMHKIETSPVDIGEVDGQFMGYEELANMLNQLDTESEQAYNRLNQLKSGIEGVDNELLKFGSQAGMEKLSQEITKQEAKVEGLKTKYKSTGTTLDSLKAKQNSAVSNLAQSQSVMSASGSKIMALRKNLGSLSTANVGKGMANASAGIQGTISKIRGVGNALKQCGVKAVQVGQKIGSAFKVAGKVAVTAMSKVFIPFTLIGKLGTNAVNKLNNSFQKMGQNMRMIKSIVMSMLLMQIFTIVSDGFKSLASQSDSFNRKMSSIYSSFVYLKNSIIACFSNVLGAVQPMLTSIINYVGEAFNKLGQFLALLSGKTTYTKAVYKQKDFNQAMSDGKDATDKANASAKEYQKTIAGFDEITKLDDNSSKSSGDSTDSNAGAWTEETINMSSTIADMIKSGDWYSVGTAIADKINDAMNSIDWQGIQKNVNAKVKKIVSAINGVVDELDWKLLGTTMGQGINTITGAIDTAFNNFHWEELGTGISNALKGLFDAKTFENATKMIKDGINGLFRALEKIATDKEMWNSMSKDFGNALKQAVSIDWTKIGNTLGQGMKNACSMVGNAIDKVDWKGFGKNFTNGLNKIIDAKVFTQLGNSIKKGVDSAVEFIGTSIKNFNWKQLGSDLAGFVNKLFSIDWKKVSKTMSDGVSGVFDAISSFINNVDTDKIAKAVIDFVSGIDWTEVIWKGFKLAWSAVVFIEKLQLSIVKELANRSFEFGKSIGEEIKKILIDVPVRQGVELYAEVKTKKEQVSKWWDDTAKPWASEKISKLMATPKTTVENVTRWWKNRSAEWKDKTSNFRNKAETTVDNVKHWWKNRAGEWKDRTVSFKIKAKSKISEIKEDFRKVINTVIGWINKYIIDNIRKISIKVPEINLPGGHKIGGQQFGFQDIKHIQSFANGGFPDGEDGLFYANHNELVGKFSNGKTVVANNQQIVSGIEQGVYNAVSSALSSSNGDKQPIINVYVGGRQVTDYIIKDVNQRTIASGRCPILV